MRRRPHIDTVGALERAHCFPRIERSACTRWALDTRLALLGWSAGALILLACEPAATSGAASKAEPATKSAALGAHGDVDAGPLPAGHPAVDAGTPQAAHPTAVADPALTREVVISGETASEMLAELSVSVPKEWVKQTPSSPMRLAQWGVPGPAGPASLTVFRFAGGGGSVADNVERWKMQIQRDPTAPVPEVKQRSAGALTVSTLDLQGDYIAPEMSKRSGDVDILGARMLVAVVEGSGDALYLKLIGPRETVTPWLDAWSSALDSLGGANAVPVAPSDSAPPAP